MSNSTFTEILGAFSVICFIAAINDWPPIANQEVTTYRVFCEECKPQEKILFRLIYRSDAATQTVTSWSKESDEIYIYRDCAIHDKNNWRCDTKDNGPSSGPRLVDGVFSENVVQTTEQIAWYKWWWLRAEQYMAKK